MTPYDHLNDDEFFDAIEQGKFEGHLFHHVFKEMMRRARKLMQQLEEKI